MIICDKIYIIFLSTATTVCYGKYGCFSDNPPFDNPLISLPSDPETIATKFVLYTREDALQKGELLDTDKNVSITKSTIDSLLKVKFIVHGFTHNGQTAWVKEMVRELLKKEKMNVIVVDWGLGSSALNLYDAAAGNTRLVGAQVADLIDVLNRKFQVAFTKFHIIGHSLGAHVAGFAGEKLVKSGKAIGRITGTTWNYFHPSPLKKQFDTCHLPICADVTQNSDFCYSFYRNRPGSCEAWI